MRETIDGASFAQMVVHAAASINMHKQQINELNVFPVPDGDTGTNMRLTISTAAAEVRKKPQKTVGEAAHTTAPALLGRLAQAEPQQQAEFITIFYGEDVAEADAQKALEIFRAACPGAEITLLSGGQPVYYYMISAE